MTPSPDQKLAAKARLERAGVIFYDTRDAADTMSRLLADYALVGGPTIGELVKRAKGHIRRLDETSN
jgi:hypothetical protein